MDQDFYFCNGRTPKTTWLGSWISAAPAYHHFTMVGKTLRLVLVETVDESVTRQKYVRVGSAVGTAVYAQACWLASVVQVPGFVVIGVVPPDKTSPLIVTELLPKLKTRHQIVPPAGGGP
jgi:hypothetical protein